MGVQCLGGCGGLFAAGAGRWLWWRYRGGGGGLDLFGKNSLCLRLCSPCAAAILQHCGAKGRLRAGPPRLLPCSSRPPRVTKPYRCFTLQADAAAILEVVKGDCGLDHHGQAVEPVRTEDWEESIRVRISGEILGHFHSMRRVAAQRREAGSAAQRPHAGCPGPPAAGGGGVAGARRGGVQRSGLRSVAQRAQRGSQRGRAPGVSGALMRGCPPPVAASNSFQRLCSHPHTAL